MALTYRAVIDDLGFKLGLPPQTIQTISAGTAGTANTTYLQSWKAITPTADVTAYFSNNTAGTATISAGTTVLVHDDLRLAAGTACWCY